MNMPTSFHRIAVLTSVDLVDTVRPADLDRPTPCEGWVLGDLLSHMTVQHHGFATAARGHGADLANWQVESVVDKVRSDPARAYADAARDVLAAFSADGADGASFALPEFGHTAVFPGSIAMGFHFVDYVVHGWDVARSIDALFRLPDDVIAAVLPLVFAVPDGDFRSAPGSPFAPAIEAGDGIGDVDRILLHLGRSPAWTP